MRIEAYNQVQQIYNKNNSKNVQKSVRTNHKDELLISEMGKDIQAAKQAVANTPDIREDVTAPIKASVKKGEYRVEIGSFADKLMKQYYEMR